MEKALLDQSHWCIKLKSLNKIQPLRNNALWGLYFKFLLLLWYCAKIQCIGRALRNQQKGLGANLRKDCGTYGIVKGGIVGLNEGLCINMWDN